MTQADVEAAAAVALEYCKESCRDYHLTRPYLVASGIRMGPSRDSDVMRPLLQRLAPSGARILIAGAADEGLAAFVWNSLPDRQPAITVIDQCETPLVLTRRFAASRGIPIETRATDILRLDDVECYDLIVAHLVFNFIEPDQRPEALIHLHHALAPNGKLVVAVRAPQPSDTPSNRTTVADVLQGLETNGFALPDEPYGLLAAMHRELVPGGSAPATLTILAPLWESAGLSLEETVDANSVGADARIRRRAYVVLQRA